MTQSAKMALAVSTGLFMDLVDSSALATALPVLAQEFHRSPIELKFALTANLLMSAILIPASGWVADRWGARRVFISALVVFLLGSIACALSNTLPQLVAARILQGVGGGMMTPVGRLIVLGNSERSELVRSLNWFTIPAIIGPLIGPPIAGLLIEHASWRWIFLINVPVGLAGLVSILKLVPRLRHPHPGRFDFTGMILVAISSIGIVASAETIGMPILPRLQWAVLFSSTVIVALIAVRHILRTEKPALELRLFAINTFRASIFGGAVLRLSLGASPFLLTLLLQSGLKWTPVESGMVMLSGTIGSFISRFMAAVLLRRFGFRPVLITFALGASLASAFPAFYRETTPAVVIIILTMTVTLIRATHFTASSALAFADVPVALNSRASTLSVVVQQLSQSLGISLGALTLYISTLPTHGTIEANSFIVPFIVIGAVGLAALPGYLALPKDVGQDMSGREPRRTAPKLQPLSPSVEGESGSILEKRTRHSAGH